VAVDGAGNALVSTDPARGAGTWRTTNIDGTTNLSGVSCPSRSLCVAVGGRDVAVSTDPTSGVWNVLLGADRTVGPECGKYAPGEGCSASLTGISCASASFCAATDSWGQVISSTNPNGGLNAWSRGGRAEGPDLSDLSCRTESACFGVCSVGFGLLGQDCPGSAYGAGDVVAWRPGSSSISSTIASRPLAAIWCQARSSCFASDSSGRMVASTSPGDGAPWSTVLAGASSSHRYDPIDDVSCPSSSSCVAIDNDANVSVSGSWTSTPSSRLARSTTAPRFHRAASLPAAKPKAPPTPPASSKLPSLGPGESSSSTAAFQAQANDTAAAATGVGYGLADPTQGMPANVVFATCTIDAVPCPKADLQGWFNRATPNAFSALRSSLPLGYLRLFVPYDALQTANGNTCIPSPAKTDGRGYQAFEQLVWAVQGAQADGLTPVVAFTNGTGIGGVPSIPDPSYGTAAANPFAGWTNAARDYSCGVSGIMRSIGVVKIGSHPVVKWEVWNEPNGAGQFNGALSNECNSSTSPCGGVYNSGGYLCYTNFGPCGPLEAAGLWALANHAATVQFGPGNYQLAAMTVSNAQNSPYETSYEQAIQGSFSCTKGYYCSRIGPSVWSIHDYDEPSSGVPSATADIKRFATTLNSHWATNQTVWITETGVALEDGATSDNNCKLSASNCGPTKSSNCAVGPYPQVDNKFGACVDAIPDAQAAGAGSILDLAAAAASDTQNVTQIDWYEFQALNPSSGWDSGLVSPPSGGYASPDGVYTANRPSLCALEQIDQSNCSGSTIDASDWSTNQYQAANP
jgi:hypothetical protein